MPSRFPPGTKVGFVNLHKSCENSSYLLSRVQRFLDLGGYRLCANPADADVIVVNTCVVTDAMKRANEEGVAALLAERPGVDVIVLGCLASMPESVVAERRQRGGRTLFVSPNDLDKLDGLFFSDASISSVFADRLVDFVPYQTGITADGRFMMISQGCVNRCSYCNIKHAKGSVRSRPPEDLYRELDAASRSDRDEVVLLADDCGSYGKDIGISLADLVDGIADRRPGARIRVYTIFPSHFLYQYPRLRSHMISGRITYCCVPVQSGSDRILDLMHRPTDLGALVRILRDLREHAPRLTLFSHFIIGFPTETEEDFRASIEIARQFDDCIYLAYGDNARTPAALIGPKCSENDIEARKRVLLRLIAAGELRGMVI